MAPCRVPDPHPQLLFLPHIDRPSQPRRCLIPAAACEGRVARNTSSAIARSYPARIAHRRRQRLLQSIHILIDRSAVPIRLAQARVLPPTIAASRRRPADEIAAWGARPRVSWSSNNARSAMVHHQSSFKLLDGPDRCIVPAHRSICGSDRESCLISDPSCNRNSRRKPRAHWGGKKCALCFGRTPADATKRWFPDRQCRMPSSGSSPRRIPRCVPEIAESRASGHPCETPFGRRLRRSRRAQSPVVFRNAMEVPPMAIFATPFQSTHAKVHPHVSSSYPPDRKAARRELLTTHFSI